MKISPPSHEIIEEYSIDPKGETGSEFHPVKNSPGEKRTGSKFDPVTAEGAKGFTRVPNALLRMEKPFSEPIDFMVYLHMFTYSHGFGRDTASMSQAQLERYTGATRNTVRKSIERLTGEGWIECVEEFEASRISRKWRVRTIQVPKSDDLQPRTGSKFDPVKNSPGENFNLTGLKINPVTGSKFHPFIESSSIEKTKNSLSRVHAREPDAVERELSEAGEGALKSYFESETLAPRKKQAELLAYRELRTSFSQEQIQIALEYLLERGLPRTGEVCHSPMAFLGKAMSEVLALAELEAEKRNDARARADRAQAAEKARVSAEAEEERLALEREQAFMRAFPTEEAQSQAIAHYGAPYAMLGRGSMLMRKLAIAAWAGGGGR